MELIRLPAGEQAGMETDCIRVEELGDGTHRLTGSAMCAGEDEGTSVSLVGDLTYATAAEAECAGLAWAEGVGVTRLHISTGTAERPLEFTEIDLPG